MGSVIAVIWLLVIPILFVVYFIKFRRMKKKYAPIVNVEEEVNRLLDDANAKTAAADRNLHASESALNEAKAEAEKFIQSGNDARLEIIKNARAEAQEIAGAALEAKGKAEEYEKAAKAFQNIIKGYGDEYIIPSSNLLDDLAEEYSFTDAGKDLKAARARSKDMVGDGDAGTCDYSEEVRKTAALSATPESPRNTRMPGSRN